MLDFPLCATRIHGNLNSGFKKREEGTESAGDVRIWRGYEVEKEARVVGRAAPSVPKEVCRSMY